MLTVAVAILAAAASASAPADGKAALERLKALAGEWQGTAETENGPAASARYEVGSGGSIVRELLFPGTEHEMMSVYQGGASGAPPWTPARSAGASSRRR